MRRPAGVLCWLALLATVLVVPAPVRAGAGTAPHGRRADAVLEMRVIGYSVEGRPIRAWHLGDPASPVKAVFLATMHGNEFRPARILQDLRDHRPIVGADLWVVPFANPDGYLGESRRNAHGVDLNRNFPVDWIRQSGSFDSGPAPASEPETMALMSFLSEIRPAYVVSLHQPLHGVDNSYDKTRWLARRLSRQLHLPRKQFTCNHGCHGTLTQWFNATLPGAAITVEYGAHLTRRQKHLTGPRGLLRSIYAAR